MTAADKMRSALELLTDGADRWGSDDCGCDDCKMKRAFARLEAVKLVTGALNDLGESVT